MILLLLISCPLDGSNGSDDDIVIIRPSQNYHQWENKYHVNKPPVGAIRCEDLEATLFANCKITKEETAVTSSSRKSRGNIEKGRGCSM